jgi:penicillin-binding protein-related factor A (putative recombinase)
MSKEGKVFEESVEQSCKDQKIFYNRIKDTFVPPDLRNRVRVSKNNYDCFMFYKGYLFPVEFKSTKTKSVSFSESIIKKHQIAALSEANAFDGIIPGFIFNFRENDNRTFFVHIDDFLLYKKCAEEGLPNTYKSKINKSSIPFAICEEIGTEIKNVKKKVKFRYYINYLLDELIEKHERK